MSSRLASIHYVAKDGFELLTFLCHPSAEIRGMYHHIQLQFKFLIREQREECREMGDFCDSDHHISESCDLSHMVVVSYLLL